jgi:hypothetical protein
MKCSKSPIFRKLALLACALVAGLFIQSAAFAQKGGKRGGSNIGGKMSIGGNRSGGFQNGGSLTGGSLRQGGGIKQGGFDGNRGMKLSAPLSGGFQEGGSKKQGSLPSFGQPGSDLARTGKFNPLPGKTGTVGGLNPVSGKRGVANPFPGSGSPGQSGIANPGTGSQSPAGHWKHLQQQWCHKPCAELIHQCHQVRCTPKLHWSYGKWCNYYPVNCHWWYNWCGSSYYFDPTCCATYNWYYYPCRVVYAGVTQQYSWHLGMNCVFIPDRGLGVQQVEAGSPAARAGFQPGMVLVAANGFELTTEGVMQSVIEGSNGRLTLTVKTDADSQLVDIEVQMTRLVASNY